MIELIHDPSGEVQLTSATTGVTEETQMTSLYMPYDSDTQSDDKTTIAELKETIKSLHSQIKVSSPCNSTSGCSYSATKQESKIF